MSRLKYKDLPTWKLHGVSRIKSASFFKSSFLYTNICLSQDCDPFWRCHPRVPSSIRFHQSVVWPRHLSCLKPKPLPVEPSCTFGHRTTKCIDPPSSVKRSLSRNVYCSLLMVVSRTRFPKLIIKNSTKNQFE